MTEPVSWPTVKRPLIAILRGIRPDEAESIVGALIDSGFELIEVPLNRPSPLPRSSFSASASARIDEALTEAA